MIVVLAAEPLECHSHDTGCARCNCLRLSEFARSGVLSVLQGVYGASDVVLIVRKMNAESSCTKRAEKDIHSIRGMKRLLPLC